MTPKWPFASLFQYGILKSVFCQRRFSIAPASDNYLKLTLKELVVAYKSSNIANIIRRLNVDYYLPAIQRPYVWMPDQIVRLFDSLLKGYPISSFLFWDVSPAEVENLSVYKFVEDFTYGDFHNESVHLTDRQMTLVLDGQQRLTSLVIGLRGSYKSKLKNKRWDNPEAWVRQHLYLNLMQDARSEEDSLTDVTYGLSFFTGEPPRSEGSYWFPVSRILQFGDQCEYDSYVDDALQKLEADGVGRTDRKVVERNLDTLYRAIWKDECVAYFTETSKSLERVLDVFVRANEGGTKLSKSDLLLSTITTTWGDLNAREEIYQFVDYLNSGLTRHNDFDKDWVMKACLVLSDLPNAYKVSNFNKKNLELIRYNWEGVKTALEATVRLVNEFGIDRDTLTSTNALLPLAYYIFRTKVRFNSTGAVDSEAVSSMHRWLVKALLASAFSGSSDNTIALARKIIQEHLDVDGGFPERNLLIGLKKHSQIDFTDSRSLDDLMAVRYTDKSCFLALSLIYPEKRWGSDQYHIDHIFPQARFNKAKLLALDVSEWALHAYSSSRDLIANLQLLPAIDNIEKSSSEFEVWIASRNADFAQCHCIPNERGLYAMSAFLEFVKQREFLLRRRFAGVLGFSAAGSDQANEVCEELIEKK